MSHLKKYGLMGTIKRVRIKKRQKTNKEDVYQINKKSKSSSKYSNVSNKDLSYSDFGSNDHLFEGTRIKDEAEKQIKTNVEKTEKIKEKTEKKVNPNLVSFDHEITDFEVKLHYLNLRDLTGKEYGRYFPPIRSNLVVIDDEKRKFSAIRAGNNQISGDIIQIINANNLKPGNIIKIEYDNEERSDQGKAIIHLKIKKQ
jgi:hypothetical protein